MTDSAVALPRFGSPYDWDAIDETVRTDGGAIVEGLLDEATLSILNAEIDGYLEAHEDAGSAASGSDSYDRFLGARTIRLHGLLDKVPSTVALIGHPEVVGWADRILSDASEAAFLNAAELIQIEPGEPAQFPHRDSDSWPHLPPTDHPVVVNAIIALDDCTLDNGATYVAPGSWAWEPGRRVSDEEWGRAVMTAGDAVLFRGDVIHRGGENTSDGRRRAISLSYCAGWLRPVENSFLNIPIAVAAAAPERVQALLGYEAHDGSSRRGGMVGLYENGDPARALRDTG